MIKYWLGILAQEGSSLVKRNQMLSIFSLHFYVTIYSIRKYCDIFNAYNGLILKNIGFKIEN